ncbi:unnamed protein product, partial [Urochloa humidicola]
HVVSRAIVLRRRTELRKRGRGAALSSFRAADASMDDAGGDGAKGAELPTMRAWPAEAGPRGEAPRRRREARWGAAGPPPPPGRTKKLGVWRSCVMLSGEAGSGEGVRAQKELVARVLQDLVNGVRAQKLKSWSLLVFSKRFKNLVMTRA